MDNVKKAAEESYATIVAEVAAPYFFEKLAAHGIAPANMDEAQEIWDAAQKLHVLYTTQQQKTATQASTKFASINAQIDSALEAAGLTQSEKVAAFNKAAEVAAKQPNIANAVLTLQAAAAATIQNAG
jgi:hypothetical protein